MSFAAKESKGPPEKIQHYSFFNLLDSCPVFKDVDISQHVDDERSCDS